LQSFRRVHHFETIPSRFRKLGVHHLREMKPPLRAKPASARAVSPTVGRP
jgi:hypothetical protein